uniref:Uncharacterized protein n=1 Tax=Strombidinopsis acuminata TaxID=141414 RepID=A0A7S3T486_9SPIT|mmetsp:Transcript_9671/g.29493  ORF Transcript_9671/g.29493 Transcript_9671/m.29493 type:complete len:104 (-) Transcript_9671:174-485(-)|eukprot:scaffold169844_cov32-Tisochrysis_lutea.AAC.1
MASVLPWDYAALPRAWVEPCLRDGDVCRIYHIVEHATGFPSSDQPINVFIVQVQRKVEVKMPRGPSPSSPSAESSVAEGPWATPSRVAPAGSAAPSPSLSADG